MNRIKITGLDKAMKAFDKRINNIKRYTPQAMSDVVKDLHRRAVEQAPLDTGDLRGSGFHEVDNGPTRATGTVGFTAPYALVQHEHTEFNHPRGGNAKYLENPLKQNTNRYINYLKNSVKDAVE
ncbi:hypothetical protein [Sporolactobacillus terrae]|uniref:HK97 gp10 family phage protein n=1 Tax=Sporolactobacillus terrae TaxID=269673 RepID=A0A5K7WS39_9BACL|nr:hypothetical protein [Sporolactobacillus terrae]BBN97501.1 hypothetical protein St703_02060 [Sporolactobacillus terrae]